MSDLAVAVGFLVGLGATQPSEDGSGTGRLVVLVLVAGGAIWWFRGRSSSTSGPKRDSIVAEFRRELLEDGISPVCLASVEVLSPSNDSDDASESWEFRVLALGTGQLLCSVDGPGYESTALSSIEVTRFESNVLQVRTAGQSVLRYRAGPSTEGLGDLAQLARALRKERERGAATADQQVASELTALHALVLSGALDAEDWAQAKAHFLGRPESVAEAAARELSGLHQLFLSGALTESEWRMKRWEILTRRN